MHELTYVLKVEFSRGAKGKKPGSPIEYSAPSLTDHLKVQGGGQRFWRLRKGR